ncbi:MAG: hypothetical protein ABI210_08195 [Abditibacteriaceae bacterium]
MLKTNKIWKRELILSIAIVCLVTVGTLMIRSTSANTPEGKELTPSMPKDIAVSIPDFSKIPDEKIKDKIDQLQSQQSENVWLLINQLDNKKLSTAAKAGIFNLLGMFRDVHALDVLVKNINFFDDRPYSGPTIAPQPRRGYVVRGALEVIGGPASDYILWYIGKSNSSISGYPSLKDKATIDGFAEVIFVVEGSRYGLLKLQDQQEATTDPQVKAQYQMVIDSFRKMVAQTQ